MPTKVPRTRATEMTKIISPVKPNGKSDESVQTLLERSKDEFVAKVKESTAGFTAGNVIVATIPSHEKDPVTPVSEATPSPEPA